MFVQALAEYADRYLADQLRDAAWDWKPVPWLIEISLQGKFLGVTSRTKEVRRGKTIVSVPMNLQVPRPAVKRTHGEHPLLAADNIAYVLGCGAWTSDELAVRRKTERHHEAFVALVQRAAEESHNAKLEACSRFYATPEEVDRARSALATAGPQSIVALSVGEPLVQHEEVRRYWQQLYERIAREHTTRNLHECIVSGDVGAIPLTHDAVKGLSNLGGQPSGVALMSFDKPSFCSYGWENNENSPVSPNRAIAYVLALNDLLRVDGRIGGKRHRFDTDGVGFVYWTRNVPELNLFELLNPKDESAVAAMRSFRPAESTADQFYLLGISGNGGRLRVRHWSVNSVNRVKNNIAEWHQRLRIAWPWNSRKPVLFSQLLNAVHREGKLSVQHALTLMERAMDGSTRSLGFVTLSAVLNRLHSPGLSSSGSASRQESRSLSSLRIPVSLIRLCLNDMFRAAGANEITEELDKNCALPGYLCGRLMCEYENLQKAARRDNKSSAFDHYFSLASTHPATVIPTIAYSGRRHLRSLWRVRPGAAYRIDELLQDIHRKLKPSEGKLYPVKLGLEDQGLFILGYYHQKAWGIAQAIEHKQPNEFDNADAGTENQI